MNEDTVALKSATPNRYAAVCSRQSPDGLGFYAKVSTREVLILDRDPWKLELYKLQAGHMVLEGQAVVGTAPVASNVLPLSFQLQLASPRPTILIANIVTKQIWTA